MDWQTLRNTFMRAIGGDPPGSQLEDELIRAYTHHPDAVERSFEKITLAHKAGKIRSPWGALKAEVAKAVDAARNPSHTTGAKRSTAVQRAEQWLRTAGLHYDRQSEILDELFGDRGMLRAHRTDELEQRMVDLWHQLRPLGEQVETEADQAAERRRTQRETLAQTAAPDESDEDRTARQKALAAHKAGLADKPTIVINWAEGGTPTNPPLTPDNHPGISNPEPTEATA